jgi:hypothetical protein
MRLIKDGPTGRTIENKVLRLTCEACQSEIECVLGEMRLQDGPEGRHYEIMCPVCDRPITEAA